MDQHGTFIARILDTGLRGLAAETAVCQRRRLEERGVRLPASAFDSLIGDTEARILALGETLATARPALFVDHVEWSRAAYAARGVAEEGLAQNLLCLGEVLSRELPPDAHGPVRGVLDEAGRVFERPPRALGRGLEADSPDAERVRRVLLAILEGRRDAALQLLLAPLDEGFSVLDVETRIVVPLQTEVGELWQRGEIHVHEEHFGSQILEEALVLLRSRLPRAPQRGKSVLLCSVTGNLHDMGTRIVADHFEFDGWTTLRFGPNLPGEDLGRAVVDFGADLVAVSAMLTSQVRRTAALLEDVREFCRGQTPPILVGGRPFNVVTDLWQVVGADGCAADGSGAVREGRRLLQLA